MREINWTTLITGLVAAGKLVLNSFGINIHDELINDTVNGVAAVIAIAAIFISHKRGVRRIESTESYGDHGPSI